MARCATAGSQSTSSTRLASPQRTAERVNALVGSPIAEAVQADVTDAGALDRILTDVDAFLVGLTNEYAEPAVFLRGWQITEITEA